MLEFQHAMDDCELMDLGFNSPKYTWSNGRSGKDLTHERLDRAVANASWSAKFNIVEVSVLAQASSDHHPFLLICFNNRDISGRRAGPSNLKQVGPNTRTMGRSLGKHGMPSPAWRTNGGRFRANYNNAKKTLQQWVRKKEN
jgi:hypothetical protein